MREVRGGDEQPGAGIACNMLDFPDMEPGIDRNRAQTRGPAGEQKFQKLGAVLHAQHDAVAGFEAVGLEPARDARYPVGELPVGPGMDAVADRLELWLSGGHVEQ